MPERNAVCLLLSLASNALMERKYKCFMGESLLSLRQAGGGFAFQPNAAPTMRELLTLFHIII